VRKLLYSMSILMAYHKSCEIMMGILRLRSLWCAHIIFLFLCLRYRSDGFAERLCSSFNENFFSYHPLQIGSQGS